MSLSSNNLKRSSILLAFGLFGAACTEPVDPTPIASVEFRIPQDSVLPNRTYQLQVRLLSATGTEITGRTPRYEALFPEIATVDQNGLVTPKATGSGAFRASIDGRSATAGVKVLDRVTRVVVAPASDQVPLGQTRQLVVTVSGANGASISGRFIRFLSSNPAVATVNAQGVVSTVSVGSATITAESELDQVSGTSTINVVSPVVASVRMTPSGTQIMRLGAFLQLTATPLDANNAPITGKTATWTSNNPTVATVNSTGVVTAVALGNTIVQAEIDGRQAAVPIVVTEVPPRSVTLSPDTINQLSGTARQLVPAVVDSLGRPVNSLATRAVVWTSTNNAVATVSATGVLTALTAGTTRVNVTVDNVRSNDITIVVSDQVQSIRLTPFLPQVMRLGATLQVSAQALNSQNQPIAGKVINWSTSNPAVATVSSSGLVTAVALGNAQITAESETRTATLTVSVTPVPLQSVTLGPATDTLAGGEQKLYVPVLVDSAGRPANLTGRNVQWNSSNQLIAIVGGTGIVTGNSQQNGTTNISVTVDNVVSNDVALTVAQIVQLQVSPNPATVRVGQTVTLTVTPKDIAGNTIKTTRSTQFSVVNGTLATTTPAGVVTGVAAGTTVVNVTLATLQGVITQVPLTVNP